MPRTPKDPDKLELRAARLLQAERPDWKGEFHIPRKGADHAQRLYRLAKKIREQWVEEQKGKSDAAGG